jgi:CrcB protein
MDVPLDPDVDAGLPTSPFPAARSTGRPRLRAGVLAAIFVGGCLGGLARYAATKAWPTPNGRFPWTILAVNTAGAFLLAVIVVLAADLVSSRYLRPLLGTGFCGAFTTFSSIVVTSDQLIADRRPGVATTYLAASIVAGLAAASAGLVTARAVTENRHRAGKGGL